MAEGKRNWNYRQLVMNHSENQHQNLWVEGQLMLWGHCINLLGNKKEKKMIKHSFWEFFKWKWEINMYKTLNEYNTKKESYT